MKAYWDSLTKEQQGELAGKVGSTPGYLRLVFNGYKKASFVLAKKLEQCTSGAITKSDLRPDNDEARISDVKNALARGEIPEQKKIERVLRDVGLSRSQAKAFMAGGYGALSLRDAEDVGSALNALKNLNF